MALLTAAEQADLWTLVTNATISVQRRVETSTTHQSAYQPVGGLSAVPVYIHEKQRLTMGGVAPQFDLTMTWPPQYGIRDGDQIVGYNPSGSANPAIILAQHVAVGGGSNGMPCKTCILVAQEPAGYSR